MVTSWVEVTVSSLDSRKSVRADFTLGGDESDESDSDYCRGHHDDDVTPVPVTGQMGSGSSTLNFFSIVIFSLIFSLACT